MINTNCDDCNHYCNLDLFLLQNQDVPKNTNDCECTDDLSVAIKNNCMYCIKFYMLKYKSGLYTIHFSISIYFGNLDVLKYIARYENNFVVHLSRYIEDAIFSNKLEILKYLFKNNYQYFQNNIYCVNNYERSVYDDTYISYAAYAGHLEIVKYLHKVVEYPYTAEVCNYAAKYDNLDILKYFNTYMKKCKWDGNVCYFAVFHDSYNCIKYLYKFRKDFKKDVLYYACYLNKIDTVKLLLNKKNIADC